MTSRASTSSLVPTASLATLADPPIRLVDGVAFDYLLIEMAATLREYAAFATTHAKRIEAEILEAGILIPAPIPTHPNLILVVGIEERRRGRSWPTRFDEEDEPLRARLETIGALVGSTFAKHLCTHRPPFDDTLNVMKFICMDVWVALFDKQVDNLWTNRRGMFQLSDALFRPIQRVSSYLGRGETVRKAKIYATFPAGVVRGILATLGYSGTVVPEIMSVPQCTMKVNIKPPKTETSGAA